MRRRIRGRQKIERVPRAKPQFNYSLPLTRRIAVKQLTRRVVRAKARRMERSAITKEVIKVERKKVRPVLSKLSTLDCRQKKAKARREYFGMKAGGAGARKNRPHQHRLTVRC